MKIKLSKIDESTFTVREKIDPEYINELKDSFKEDGQWDPILVRHSKDGTYELIAGHNRVQAAKELGWTEIEATVKDINDTDAMFLSLKTNLLRQEMSQREQGKVLLQIKEAFQISGPELAKRIGKKKDWVNDRIRLALDLHPQVAKALEDGKIKSQIAEVISGLKKEEQPPFLLYILENNITDRNEAYKARKRFLNNTIYTIGYEGKEIQQYIDTLKNNGIEQLIEVRFSTESLYKPDFNGIILGRELENAKIKYVHRKDLGVPYEWQNPYKDGAVPVECLEKYFIWHTEMEIDFKKFVDDIMYTGKTVLMCMEKYAKPMRDQKIHCHRHILANLILETKEFKERVDL